MKKSILISLICIFAVLAMGILSAGAEAVRVAINPDSKPFKYFIPLALTQGQHKVKERF